MTMDMQDKFYKRWLDCGCCGNDFQTWPTYRDQDQDAGYGICRGCQADAIRENRKHVARGVELLRSALSPTNQAKLDAMPPWRKRAIVFQAHEAGHLTWSIQKR